MKKVARFLRARDAGAAPCRQVRAAAEDLLREMDATIAEMVETRESGVVAACPTEAAAATRSVGAIRWRLTARRGPLTACHEPTESHVLVLPSGLGSSPH